jgi:hypothetical protein
MRLADLTHSLQGHDLGHLRIVAELWGLELNAPDARSALDQLAPAILSGQLVAEVLELLPAQAQSALAALLQNEGRLPWSQFTRRFGTVREMGAGRRDRERPHQNPVSAAEMLWYRALVARAFFDTPTGPEEFAYLPADLIPLLPMAGDKTSLSLGRPAVKGERARPILSTDRILDEACTLLAAARANLPLAGLTFSTRPLEPYPLSPAALRSLLSAIGLLDAAGLPQSEPTRAFLEPGRGAALAWLARAWLDSPVFNELRLIPGLICEGEWENDPRYTRRTILDWITTLPPGTWWNLEAFISAIKQRYPDFQRPAGDYDSWFIRDEQTGEFLRGFAHWDQVEGSLIRYLICGPLHWLGLMDLATHAELSPADPAPISAFRLSGWAPALLAGQAPAGLPEEVAPLLAHSDARLRLPRLAPRAVRYQITRFSAWDGEEKDAYRYRLTPASLERARQQGLRIAHLLALLRRHASAVPPNLIRALERWDEYGAEARLERVLVLRLSSPEILKELRSSRAARFLGDPLGPTAVIVNDGAWERVLAYLAEMGYLAEAEIGNRMV